MSSSKTVSNLNIRKFPSYDSYKNATVGEDDLCVVDEGGQPIIEVANLPTASANWEGRTILDKSVSRFYKCYSDGGNPATYSWSEVKVQTAPTMYSATATLEVADWSSNTQTISVSGVTTTNVVIVSPDPASNSDYTSAGIVCSAQGTDSLTFTCDTVPSNAITVNVVIFDF